ncbi:disease resistance protein RPV1-like isoform X2 [Arachis stenosperma]|uniref:disease resistance protein RPV1-like isoform X2 n=1 Tax=Arachis stenosperma TaxID=217475 RepID=UPI0025AC9E51|nr:disease resistance protein RPV1-like isoform X2 [Arachis stenosperma]
MEIDRAKFLCSYGGEIKSSGSNNKLAYVGGTNKLLYVERRIDFTAIVAEISSLFDGACNGDYFFKYQVPGSDDLNALVSVTNDRDLHNMMLMFDQLYRDSPGFPRMRLFLFPNPNKPLDSVKPDSNGLSSNLWKHDVFISFRGKDTLTGFTSHLVKALNKKHIKTFIGDELHKGDCISDSLTRAIDNSSVSIVILSENFVTSSWCVDELLKIMECGRKVIPVFYGVDPSDVRKQLVSFNEKFKSHLQSNINNLLKWLDALAKVADLEGWDSSSCRDDFELVEKIVKDVLRKLNNPCLPKDIKGVVGINKNLEKLELLLSSVPDEQTGIIGICGMAGIGKTTVVKKLFEKHSYWYEGSCFLEGVLERLEKYGQEIDELCNQLHSKLLEGKDFPNSMADTNSAKCCLCRQRSFIVLDDVGSSKQLEYLVGDLQCYGAGSRIIVITRNKSVLEKRVEKIYKMEVLDFQDSLTLFSLNAFNQNYPKTGYQELSWKAVTYCKGVPLNLKVLGSFLHSKSETEWDSALQKLEKNPNASIQNVLRLSYDGSDYQQNHIVLDIATSFKGEQKEQRIDVLISSLLDEALLAIYDHFELLQDLNKKWGGESFVRNLSRILKIIAICGVLVIIVMFWKTARNSFN